MDSAREKFLNRMTENINYSEISLDWRIILKADKKNVCEHFI